jgi:uncharacterized protein (DUF697 family)
MEKLELVHHAHRLHHSIDHLMKGNLGDNVTSIIKQHAVTAAAVGLVPIPIVGIAGLVANTWAMYVRINQEVGIPFEKNVMKSIATGIGTNLLAIMPGMVLGKFAAQLAKAVPGLGSVGGMAIDSATNYAIILVMGTIYVVALTKLFSKGEPITEESLKRATKEASADKSFVKGAFQAAKSEYKPSTSDAAHQ